MKLTCDSSVVFKLIGLSVFVLLFVCSGTEGVKRKKPGRSLERLDTTEPELSIKNGTSSFVSRLSKFISPRVIDELTASFNHYGLPGTIATGAVAILIIPIYLAAALVGWVPLRNILYPPSSEPDHYSSYKPTITYYQAGSSGSAKHGYPSLSPMYGYPEVSTMGPMYGYPPAQQDGYPPAPSSTPAPQYGYPPAPAPTPVPQYGYPPAPAPTPAPQYGYPGPSPSYGYTSSSDPEPSVSYGYSPPDPAPMYGYQAMASAPAPASHYGSPKSSYGAPEVDKMAKAEVKMSARKARSIRLHDDQCAERLACEISKATKGIKLPSWMDKVVDILPWKESRIINGARKFVADAKDCSKYLCDSYELWGKMQ